MTATRSQRTKFLSGGLVAAAVACVVALWTHQDVAGSAGGSQPAACQVREMHRIRSVGAGLDWSRAKNLLAIAEPDGAGNSQVYVLRPDGTDVKCLTCDQVSGGPPVDVHKGVPHWYPSGDYILLQVERKDHGGKRSIATPGSGRYNDIWMTTASGDRWWRLTDDANRDAGVLFPVPSPNGDRLAWAQRFKGPAHPTATLLSLARGKPTKDMWGHWRLNVADFRIDGGRPVLGTPTSYTPGDASFIEMQVWDPRDPDKLYFAADIDDPHPYLLDIYAFDLRTRRATAFVREGENWEEHLNFSPDGQKVTYMSSVCCQWNSNDLRTLAAELYLMNADGSNRTRLTSFNDPDSRYYERGKHSVVAKSVWGPDGRQVVFARILIGGGAPSESGPPTDLWMLTFEGACGGR